MRVVQHTGAVKIIKRSYFNTFLFLPIAAVRLASRWFHLKKRQSDFDINGALVNGMLFRIFDLERRLLHHANYPFGVSILLVLRKM